MAFVDTTSNTISSTTSNEISNITFTYIELQNLIDNLQNFKNMLRYIQAPAKNITNFSKHSITSSFNVIVDSLQKRLDNYQENEIIYIDLQNLIDKLLDFKTIIRKNPPTKNTLNVSQNKMSDCLHEIITQLQKKLDTYQQNKIVCNDTLPVCNTNQQIIQ